MQQTCFTTETFLESASPDSIGFSSSYTVGTPFAHYKIRKHINNH
jgi:hypothetical protein